MLKTFQIHYVLSNSNYLSPLYQIVGVGGGGWGGGWHIANFGKRNPQVPQVHLIIIRE